MNCAWNNHWLQHNARSLNLELLNQRKTYCISNYRLAIEIGQWSSIPISRHTRLDHFFFYNAVENEAHFVLEYLLYNPIRDKFSSLFANVVPGSLKCSFQLDQLVSISLYLIKATALCHSKEIIDKKPSWCTFNPISLFGFLNFKINSISYHWLYSLCGSTSKCMIHSSWTPMAMKVRTLIEWNM
jgi:hypothetical protein